MIIDPVLIPDHDEEGCTDFTLAEGCSCWITVGDVSLYIMQTANGTVTVEAMPKGVCEADTTMQGMILSPREVAAFRAQYESEVGE